MIYGYARVSTLDQNLERQLDLLKQYGVDHIFQEKMSGTKRDRPELNKMLSHVTAGDTIVVESLSRLGRSTKDLIELVELLGQNTHTFCQHSASLSFRKAINNQHFDQQ